MGYIWNDYSIEKRYQVSFGSISPYIEVWDSTAPLVFVNIFYRISDILLPSSLVNKEKTWEEAEEGQEVAEELNDLVEKYTNEGRYQDIANILIHYIAQLDLLKGIRLQEMIEMINEEEIVLGRYGKQASSQYQLLQKEDQYVILRHLARYDLGLQRETVFEEVLDELFGVKEIYYEEPMDMLHICLGKPKNEYHDRLYSLCEYFFKDIGLKVAIYWKNEHFGRIGIDSTMMIGQILIV